MRLHPSIAAACPECGGRGVCFGDGLTATARRCGCVGPCDLCRDTGRIPDVTHPRHALGKAPKIACCCGGLDTTIGLFNAAGVPSRYHAASRGTFKPSRDQHAIVTALGTWSRTYTRGSRGWVLYGDVGRGKTHLVCAALRELVFTHAVSVRFVEFTHLLAAMKAGFDRGVGAATLLGPLLDADVLAIDEIGKGRCTEFEVATMDEIVSERYNRGKTTLGTTNFSPLPTLSMGRSSINLANPGVLPGLIDRVGPRVFSRLQELCDFHELRGEDWRASASTREQVQRGGGST